MQTGKRTSMVLTRWRDTEQISHRAVPLQRHWTEQLLLAIHLMWDHTASFLFKSQISIWVQQCLQWDRITQSAELLYCGYLVMRVFLFLKKREQGQFTAHFLHLYVPPLTANAISLPPCAFFNSAKYPHACCEHLAAEERVLVPLLAFFKEDGALITLLGSW